MKLVQFSNARSGDDSGSSFYNRGEDIHGSVCLYEYGQPEAMLFSYDVKMDETPDSIYAYAQINGETVHTVEIDKLTGEKKHIGIGAV